MGLEQRKSPRLETRVGNKGLIAISKPPFLRVVMIYKKTPRLTWGSVNAMHLHIIIPSLTIELRSANCKQSKGGINYGSQ